MAAAIGHLRHGEERPVHIDKTHVCFSLKDHQLKKVSLFYCASPQGKMLTHFLRNCM